MESDRKFSIAVILTRYDCDDDTIVGAILHEVVEDCDDHGRDQHERQIAEKFGPEVLQIVLDVTHVTHDAEGNALSSEARKVVYLEHLANASEKAR